ncbi:IS1182 family transposase [Nocardia pseudovaccinii]|uniref:IS1182 family transposase n=1 Tax=Nocardia pseudovaccinii TaxID=189540 RepID=UPI003D94CB94
MQGEGGSDPQLMDAAALVGHLVPAGSVFAFLAEHRREVFPAGMFEDLFPSRTGRPSLACEVAASVLLLQALHDLSDRETVQALRCDLRWKVACGLALDDEGFDPSTLTYWRRRLAKSSNPNRIFDAVRAVVAETGVLKGKTRRALDSVVLDDAVATQDTVTQLIAAIRRVRREVPGAAAVIAADCDAHDYDDPGKPVIAWDDATAREALVSALVNDAIVVVNALADKEFDDDARDKAAQALALLALIAGQDVEPAEGSDGTDGRWRIARKVATDRVISVVDPDARHIHKTVHKRQDGYKAHVAVEPDTGLFTDGRLSKGNGSDNHESVVGLDLLSSEDGSRDVLGDTAYGSADMRAELAGRGHTAIIKPFPLRSAVKGGFTLDDFTVDHHARTATCPNGVTRSITAKHRVVFGVACRDCPLRRRCTTSKDGRTLNLHQHDNLLRRARQNWREDPDLVAAYRKHRPMVERSISWLIGPKGRCRKLRYRGIAANNQWLHTRIAALNLRRLLNLGLDRIDNTWAIA